MRNHRSMLLIASCTSLMLLAGCSKSPATDAASPAESGQPGPAGSGSSFAARIIGADNEPENWLSHGRTYTEQRFSPLTSINSDNVGGLSLAWYYDVPTRRGMEATPIVEDGRMYSTGPWSIVYALNAATGEELWKYDPELTKVTGARGCCDAVNRGVALWENMVITGIFDGRLVALDRQTGELLWSVDTVEDNRYTITGAPRVVKGKVIIGNGGADWGVRGYVSAYSADTGELLWRFYTVPGNPADGFESAAMEMAAETWTGTWWKHGGGGTAWDAFAYDPELDLLYIGVGNGSPWNQAYRSPAGGDNLFLSSIVAVRPDTGEYVWHYQTTPGESWDFTATQSLILADLEIGGKPRKAILQAPKNGFFYVIDRETGEFISGEKFANVTWASHIDPQTGRPVETANARYLEKAELASPTPFGAHNWHPMSFSPTTGLVYIPVQDVPFTYMSDPDWQAKVAHVWNTGQLWPAFPEDPEVLEQVVPLIKGRLLAWNPVEQQAAWQVDMPTIWNGGTLTTAGNLVFQGTPSGEFYAYRADTGERLWSADTQSGVMAGPVSYRVNGEQYIAVSAGVGGVLGLAAGPLAKAYGVRPINRVLAFKLGGTASLPPLPEVSAPQLDPPPLTASTEQIAHGRKLYHRYCFLCHGDGAVSGGIIPDLRYSGKGIHETWDGIVIGGLLEAGGMPSFEDVLTIEQAQAIRSFVIKRAYDQLAQAEAVNE